MEQSAPAAARASAPALSIEAIRSQQNFALAAAAGVATAVGGAILWAVVTVVTQMELGIAAVALGFIVGRAIRETGRGIDPLFGFLGAACALAGCLLGNLLSAIAIFAKARGLTAGEAIGLLEPGTAGQLFTAFFQPMDLLFYGIAIYEGYRFSFKYAKKR